MFIFSFKQLVLFLDRIYDRFIFYGGIAWNNKILIIKKSIIKMKKKIKNFFLFFFRKNKRHLLLFYRIYYNPCFEIYFYWFHFLSLWPLFLI